MSLTKARIRRFEEDQQAYGTETALFNLLWLKASDDLRAIGVTGLTTRMVARRRPHGTPDGRVIGKGKS